jgi:hypothetical protein
MDGMGLEGPTAVYVARRDRYAAVRAGLERRATINGNVSLALVVAAVVGVGLAIWQGGPLFISIAALLGLGFVGAYLSHGRLTRRRDELGELAAINEEGLRRLARDWSGLPLRAPAGPPPEHAYAADLDLLGHASLQHLLSTPDTPAGRSILQRWLLVPAPAPIVRARQAGAAELAPRVDLREALALAGRRIGPAQPDYERFLDWAEREVWLSRRPALVWTPRLLAVVALGLVVAQLSGLLPYPVWVVAALVDVAFDQLAGGGVRATLEEVAARQGGLGAFARLFDTISGEGFTAEELRRIQADLGSGGGSAGKQMARLGRIMGLAELRRSQFFFLIQALTLWNYHVLWLLERWQRANGRHARVWLAAAGDFEALAALAALAHDHPSWTFPELTAPASSAEVLRAEGLGHPLLPPAACVGNAVSVGPPGRFLLVTGSNMSGKSTLLRAIGVNVALAQAGGPVCAAQMALRPVRLATTIRVQDSLEAGVSVFMAELLRLKVVVEAARQVKAAPPERAPVLLFLLDEILHGTNTHERQVAARHVLRHLLDLGATGALSTHDLTLAEPPDIAARACAVYFTERFERGPDGPIMGFDYTLRAGLATSTNALKLMEIIGLPVEDGR